MCGICGFTKEDPGRIAMMTESLAHRGPDAHGTFVSGGFSLGHARLSILDPSEAGRQPMRAPHKRAHIVHNGEVYNFKSLRTEFELECKTETDTEVMLRMYEREGIDFVQRLRGMFAFALYDESSETLHLVRDPSGIKPLYFTIMDGVLYFASETRALLTVLPRRPQIDHHGLSLYARHGYVPRPRTLLEGVQALECGQILSWRRGNIEVQRFEQRAPSSDYRVSPREALDKLPAIMQDSIDAHLIADRPLGLFLSGGLDSSICLHHMHKAGLKNVKTFTVRFAVPSEPGWERFNQDADVAIRTSKHFHTDHQELSVTARDCLDHYAEATASLDQPNANQTAVVLYLLSKRAKQSVDVALTGVGGDELFGGYPRYRVVRVLKAFQHVPSSAKRIIARTLRQPVDVWQTQVGPALAERLLTSLSDDVAQLTTGDWYTRAEVAEYLDERFPSDAVNAVHRFMEYDRMGWLVDESLRLTDGTSMASGLETRVPFLDRHIIGLAHRVNPHAHVSIFATKRLLRRAYQSVLPKSVIEMPKAGFFSPLAKWLRSDCRPLLEEARNSEYLAPYFDMKAISKMADDHLSVKRYALRELTMLIQLHYWFKNVYYRSPARGWGG